MPRYIAFLRGVSPMNAKMPELKRCFEAAGFTDVKTILSSGNVAFTAAAKSETALARAAEAAMAKRLGESFRTIVRSTRHLGDLLEADPFAVHRLPAKAKRIVTFLDKPAKVKLSLPFEADGARIVAMKGREVFTAYVPSPRGALFMRLIEKTFGKSVTTRTWDTVKKCATAASSSR
jgi:uncharacterized protein (DUF1697 family)